MLLQCVSGKRNNFGKKYPIIKAKKFCKQTIPKISGKCSINTILFFANAPIKKAKKKTSASIFMDLDILLTKAGKYAFNEMPAIKGNTSNNNIELNNDQNEI